MREARPNTLSSKCLIKETPTSARPGIIITSNLAPEIFFVQNLSQTELTYVYNRPAWNPISRPKASTYLARS